MPIVYVHGVANRDDGVSYPERWNQISQYLRRYIAPVISGHPDQVAIRDAYWGDVGAQFRWNGASRPRTPLLGQGAANAPTKADQAFAIAALPQVVGWLPVNPPTPATSGVLIPAGATSATGSAADFRLKDLSPDQLSDLLAAVIESITTEPRERTRLTLAADAVSHNQATSQQLAACKDRAAEIALLKSLVEARYRQEQPNQGLIGMGAFDFLNPFKDRLSEATSRVGSVPGFVLSRALAEARKPINDQVTLFLGDVFNYLAYRQKDNQEPGEIPSRVIAKLREALQATVDNNEPLIVLTHSMGGQIVYDLATYFLPQLAEKIRVDFWCATASQVGLFEEMKLFLASDESYSLAKKNRVPFPSREHLGGWYNVWDHNDFLSYTAREVFEGVDDENYNGGMSVISAHGGYLDRPSFYRQFAEKLQQAQTQDWWRL